MHRVPQATLFPGACILTKTGDGPFIDLLRENQYGERIYVAEQVAADMARLMGFWGPEEVAAAEKASGDAQFLRERIVWLETELYALQRSIRHTLNRGAVETKEGVLKLRPVPGQRAVELPADSELELPSAPADQGGSG